MTGTLMGDADWGEFIWQSIQQVLLVSVVLSFFSGAIEWIIILISEVVMASFKQSKAQQKLIKKIGEKIFEELNNQLSELQWKIREKTEFEFSKIANSLTEALQIQIDGVRNEQNRIIEEKQQEGLSIQDEKHRLDQIKIEVIKQFNDISLLIHNRTYSLEEIEWLAKGKLLMSGVDA